LPATNVRGSCMRASASSHGRFGRLKEAMDAEGLEPCSPQVPNNGRSSLHARSQVASIRAGPRSTATSPRLYTRLLKVQPHALDVGVCEEISSMAHRTSCSCRLHRHCLTFWNYGSVQRSAPMHYTALQALRLHRLFTAVVIVHQLLQGNTNLEFNTRHHVLIPVTAAGAHGMFHLHVLEAAGHFGRSDLHTRRLR
jgi:hypothetical protein